MRDGHRCLLTGSFDETSAEKSHELREQRTRQRAGTNVIAACHILNESTMQGVDPTVASENNLMINKVCAVTSPVVSRPHHQRSRQLTPVLPWPFLIPSDLKNSLKMPSEQMVSIV